MSISLPAALLREARLSRPAAFTRKTVHHDAASSSTEWITYCAYVNSDCDVLGANALLYSTLTTSNGTTLSEPQGSAIGVFSGYWYIANTGDSNVPFFYINGDGSPYGVYGAFAFPNPLPDPNEYPVDVAVREKGNKSGLVTSTTLAVSNFIGTSGEIGSVTVYTSQGSSYSTSTLHDGDAEEGIGVAFDNQGDCFWSFNEVASSKPGQIDMFKGCKGTPQRLEAITTEFAGGVAFDNSDDLWYVDQGTGSIYECLQPLNPSNPGCTRAFAGTEFGDPVMINFDLETANLYVADIGAGLVYQCAVGASSCVPFYSTPNDPPEGVAVDSVAGFTADDLHTPAIDEVPQAKAAHATALAPPQPEGLTPQNFWSAYNLGASGPTTGAGKLVAVVEVAVNSAAATDLQAYRQAFGLNPPGGAPPFTVLNQSGGPPPGGRGVASSHSSGVVEMVAATCPLCSIDLIEATSASPADVFKAFETAVSLGPAVVTNSYGICESASYTSGYKGVIFRTPVREPVWHLVHSTAFPDLAAAGNYGYNYCERDPVTGLSSPGAEYPADYFDSIAVGGTVLEADPSTPRGWTEAVWPSTTSACSAVVAQPKWQPNPPWNQCGQRQANDIAFVATNIALYRNGVWTVGAGTSYATPAIAGLYAAVGAKAVNAKPLYERAVKRTLATFPVTAGTNGVGSGPSSNCSGAADTYMCDATKSITFAAPDSSQYNGPTGWGTPNGLGIFRLQ